MSAKTKFTYDETKFKPGQRQAGLLLAERDFIPKGERRTMDAIGDEVGVSRITLWNWSTQDANFIAYRNYLASEMMDGHLSAVYAKLLEVIQDGNTKGIELFLKRIGDLDTKSDVTIRDGKDEVSHEERKRALQERLGLTKSDGDSDE